jgi:hypothetical protein
MDRVRADNPDAYTLELGDTEQLENQIPIQLSSKVHPNFGDVEAYF